MIRDGCLKDFWNKEKVLQGKVVSCMLLKDRTLVIVAKNTVGTNNGFCKQWILHDMVQKFLTKNMKSSQYKPQKPTETGGFCSAIFYFPTCIKSLY